MPGGPWRVLLACDGKAMIDKSLFVKTMELLLERDVIRLRTRDDNRRMGVEFCNDDPLVESAVDLLDTGLELDLPDNNGLASWYLYDCSTTRDKGHPVRARIRKEEYLIMNSGELYDFALDLKQAQAEEREA